MSKSSNFDSALSSNREVYVLSKHKNNRFQERGNVRVNGEEKLSPSASAHLLELLRFEFVRRNKNMEGEHMFALAAILITLFSINRLDNLAFSSVAFSNLRSCELSLSVLYGMLTIFFMVAGLSSLAFIAKMWWDGCSILRTGSYDYRREKLDEFDGFWEGNRSGRCRVRKFICVISLCYVFSLCIHPELWCDNWEFGLGTIFIFMFACLFFCFLLWAPPCWCSCQSCCYKSQESTRMRQSRVIKEDPRHLDNYWPSNVENSSFQHDKKNKVRRQPSRWNRARQSIELNVSQKQMITIGVGEPYASHKVEIMSPHAKHSKRQPVEHIYEHQVQDYHTDEELEPQSDTVTPRVFANDWYLENEKKLRVSKSRSAERKVNVRNMERQSVEIPFGGWDDLEPRAPTPPRRVSFQSKDEDQRFERYDNLEKRIADNKRDVLLVRGKASEMKHGSKRESPSYPRRENPSKRIKVISRKKKPKRRHTIHTTPALTYRTESPRSDRDWRPPKVELSESVGVVDWLPEQGNFSHGYTKGGKEKKMRSMTYDQQLTDIWQETSRASTQDEVEVLRQSGGWTGQASWTTQEVISAPPKFIPEEKQKPPNNRFSGKPDEIKPSNRNYKAIEKAQIDKRRKSRENELEQKINTNGRQSFGQSLQLESLSRNISVDFTIQSPIRVSAGRNVFADDEKNPSGDHVVNQNNHHTTKEVNRYDGEAATSSSFEEDDEVADVKDQEENEIIVRVMEKKVRLKATTRSRVDDRKKQTSKRKRKKRSKWDESPEPVSISSVKFLRSDSVAVIKKKPKAKVSAPKPRFQGKRTHLTKDSMDVFRNNNRLGQWKTNNLFSTMNSGDQNNHPKIEKGSFKQLDASLGKGGYKTKTEQKIGSYEPSDSKVTNKKQPTINRNAGKMSNKSSKKESQNSQLVHDEPKQYQIKNTDGLTSDIGLTVVVPTNNKMGWQEQKSSAHTPITIVQLSESSLSPSGSDVEDDSSSFSYEENKEVKEEVPMFYSHEKMNLHTVVELPGESNDTGSTKHSNQQQSPASSLMSYDDLSL